MADVSYQSWAKKWLSDMGSGNAGSGRIDRGPFENTASKVGRQAPKRNSGGSRVPPPTEGQVRKKGGIR
jgi:hypothetical protein